MDTRPLRGSLRCYLSFLGQQVVFFQRRTQRQIQNHRADGGKDGVHQRDAAGDLGGDAGQLHRLTENVPVAEVAEERVGEHIHQQAAERRADYRAQVSALVGGVPVFQMEHLVGKRAADNADDELEDECGDGVAGVTGHDVRQRQTDGARQTTRNAVQQHGGERREGVAQMEGGPGAQHVGDAEELVGHKAQRGHDADDADFAHSEFGFGQNRHQNGEGHHREQQQPQDGCRHKNFPLSLDFSPRGGYAPIIAISGTG